MVHCELMECNELRSAEGDNHASLCPFVPDRKVADKRGAFLSRFLTRVSDQQAGICEGFYQTVSPKYENTLREMRLFQKENCDFLLIFSAKYGLIFRHST